MVAVLLAVAAAGVGPTDEGSGDEDDDRERGGAHGGEGHSFLDGARSGGRVLGSAMIQ
jgi:hypothetical protein